MDASAWIALASLGAMLLLAIAGAVWAGIKVAFTMGRHAQRLDDVEDDVDKVGDRVDDVESKLDGIDCKTELAALRAMLGEFKEAVLQRLEGLERTVRGAPEPRPRVVK